MNSKLTYHRYLWMVIILLLSACGEVKNNAIITQAAATAFVRLTHIAASTPTASPTETPAPMPSQIPLPLVAVDGLRVAYIIDGNLYVQDSGGQPVQLTHSGLDRIPIFSGDDQKILFYRGEAFDAYLINTDGSQEQRLVPPGLLTKLNLGYSEFTRIGNIVFVPGTHQLLFNTSEVKPWSHSAPHMSPMDVQPNQDVLLLDTDTGKIKRLLAPGKGGIFQISPDGKLDVDYPRDYIDVVGIYGQINRRHMITSQPNWNYSMRYPFWSQDSSKCIFVVPIGGSGDGTDGPRPDTLWRYSVESNSAVEIRLNPPPIEDNYALSPDGNWIAYTYNYIRRCCMNDKTW